MTGDRSDHRHLDESTAAVAAVLGVSRLEDEQQVERVDGRRETLVHLAAYVDDFAHGSAGKSEDEAVAAEIEKARARARGGELLEMPSDAELSVLKAEKVI